MKPTLIAQEINTAALRILTDQVSLRSDVMKSVYGNDCVWDFGIQVDGNVESGTLLAMISAGGELNVQTGTMSELKRTPSDADPYDSYISEFIKILGPSQRFVLVDSSSPVRTCLGSQYAGWPFSFNEYFAMISGPGRIVRGKEKLFNHFDAVKSSDVAVLVLETNQLPGEADRDAIRKELSWENSPHNQLHLCIAPTNSLAGRTQVVARSLETALHQYEHLKGDLGWITMGTGIAPIPEKQTSSLNAIAATNDAIIYGGLAGIAGLNSEQTDQIEFLKKLPSSESPDYGKGFLELFQKAEYDFYKMDPRIFAPASVFSLQEPNTVYGNTNPEKLKQLWKC